jgi:hypothetical protein
LHLYGTATNTFIIYWYRNLYLSRQLFLLNAELAVLLLLQLLLLLLLLLLLWERKRQVVGVLTPSCASTQGHCASQQHLKRNKAGGYKEMSSILVI